jgi:hypothetical protein
LDDGKEREGDCQRIRGREADEGRVDSQLAYWSIQLIEINLSGYFQQLAFSPAPASRQFYQSMMPDVEVFDLIQFDSWKG